MMLLNSFINEYWEDYMIKSSPTSNPHLVTFDLEEDTVRCDCEDFKYRKENLKFGGVSLFEKERHCKHIRYCLKIRGAIKDG